MALQLSVTVRNARLDAIETAISTAFFKFEGDLGVDAVADDLVVRDLRLEVLDINRADIAQRPAGLLNGGTSSSFPAGFGLCEDLDDFQHGDISSHRIVALSF